MEFYNKAMMDNMAMQYYAKGVADGIGVTIGGIVLYKVTRYFVKAYIDYKVEEESKKKGHC